MVGSHPAERTDAARNRRKILAAGERLLAENGVEALSMDKVARAAGVGVGTVYRRFTDLTGLARAMLDEREVDLQSGFLHGPPPLGPGAPHAERIRAFLDALLDRVDQQSSLLLVAESTTPTARYRSPAYAVYHTHLTRLLGEINPTVDAAYFADALLAPLSTNLVVFQCADRAMSLRRIRDGVIAMADALIRDVAR